MLTGLQIFWTFVKKYWFIFLAIAAFVLGYIFFRKQDVDLSKIIEGINSDHKKDLDLIKKKENQIETAKREIEEETVKKLQESDSKFDSMEKDLVDQQKNRSEEILKESGSDPDILADKLAKELGSKKL